MDNSGNVIINMKVGYWVIFTSILISCGMWYMLVEMNSRFTQQRTEMNLRFSEQRTEMNLRFSERTAVTNRLIDNLTDLQNSHNNLKLSVVRHGNE